jgi:hypothetical protein
MLLQLLVSLHLSTDQLVALQMLHFMLLSLCYPRFVSTFNRHGCSGWLEIPQHQILMHVEIAGPATANRPVVVIAGAAAPATANRPGQESKTC